MSKSGKICQPIVFITLFFNCTLKMDPTILPMYKVLFTENIMLQQKTGLPLRRSRRHLMFFACLSCPPHIWVETMRRSWLSIVTYVDASTFAIRLSILSPKTKSLKHKSKRRINLRWDPQQRPRATRNIIASWRRLRIRFCFDKSLFFAIFWHESFFISRLTIFYIAWKHLALYLKK